jgi:hypothetical protein
VFLRLSLRLVRRELLPGVTAVANLLRMEALVAGYRIRTIIL